MKAKIIGYGVSGKAAESFLAARQIETVVVADAEEVVPLDYDFCVLSPGVPLAKVKTEDVPIVAEVELPFYLDKNIKPRCVVAVTGTNGKTTVVKQITQMCQAAGKAVVMCGNVGVPVSRVAEQLNDHIAVIEVSSFMLEQTQILRPQIAVLTNITSDHLDRHQTMAEYVRCKQQIVANQKRGDILIVNWDDANARAVGQAVAKTRVTKVIWYSTSEPVTGYYVRKGQIYERLGWRTRSLFAATDLGGMPHTLSNALAVVAVGRRLGVPLSAIKTATRYREQEHRIALVADQQGVAYYDDSKATNMAATIAATQAFQLPVCLILCGLTKGQDYHELFSALPATVQSIIVFGACQETVTAVAREVGFKAVYPVPDLSAAVAKAASIAPRPGVVLFSPAGSSFDQFHDYAARGNAFQTAVRNLVMVTPQC